MTKEEKINEFMNILRNPDKIVKNIYGKLEYRKNGKIYFRYNPKNGTLDCDYILVWSVFEKEYSLSDQEIIDLIQDTVKNTFNGMVVTVDIFFSLSNS